MMQFSIISGIYVLEEPYDLRYVSFHWVQKKQMGNFCYMDLAHGVIRRTKVI